MPEPSYVEDHDIEKVPYFRQNQQKISSESRSVLLLLTLLSIITKITFGF